VLLSQEGRHFVAANLHRANPLWLDDDVNDPKQSLTILPSLTSPEGVSLPVSSMNGIQRAHTNGRPPATASAKINILC
jgi:hypothetical protein